PCCLRRVPRPPLRFSFCLTGAPRDLLSFPTRRSSDLPKISATQLHMGVFDFSCDGCCGRSLIIAVADLFMGAVAGLPTAPPGYIDRKSTRLNSSHVKISYAVFCLKKKNEQRARDTEVL